tara:strand:- start:494 stop:1279 length:786 start_codon:yes stop_codon:yes gene_type:complete
MAGKTKTTADGQTQQSKFPSEVIDLPSGGKIYGKDSPLYDGKLEIKYMTAREEDILTSQNLIKKGMVIDKLMDSLILTPGVDSKTLIIGDKNAVMVAARILAYGPEYTAEVTNPITLEKSKHSFDLSECGFKELQEDIDYSTNEFVFELPVTKAKIIFKLLSGTDELNINKELESRKKIGQSAEVTTRMKHSIVSVDGEDNRAAINNYVDNMLSRDSLAFRQEMARIAPDIDLSQEVEIEGETVKVDIPMTVNFFWPSAGK